MAGYRTAGENFVNATTKNDQIVRQREEYTAKNNERLVSEKLGIGSDTSRIFSGFEAQDILNASVERFKALDNSSPLGNPDFERGSKLNSQNTKNIFDDLSQAEDNPNKKGPNLVPPDLDKLISGAIVPGSDEAIGSEHDKSRGFGWNDSRNEEGTESSTIGTYFSRHYNHEGASDNKPVLGESNDLGDDPINYK